MEYSSNQTRNKANIDGFLETWTNEPYRINEVRVGCEVNFNKIFPKVVERRPIQHVLEDLAALEREIVLLDARIAADVEARG